MIPALVLLAIAFAGATLARERERELATSDRRIS